MQLFSCRVSADLSLSELHNLSIAKEKQIKQTVTSSQWVFKSQKELNIHPRERSFSYFCWQIKQTDIPSSSCWCNFSRQCLKHLTQSPNTISKRISCHTRDSKSDSLLSKVSETCTSTNVKNKSKYDLLPQTVID